VLTELILAKRSVQHLSLTWGILSKEACAHMKSLLLDKQCVSRSLNIEAAIDSWNEIIDGLSKNKSFKCLRLFEFNNEGISQIIATLYS
jgi:hypothetical protein